MTEKEEEIMGLRGEPSLPEGLDLHTSLQMIVMALLTKTQCSAPPTQLLSFFSIVTIVRNKSKRYISILKAISQVASKPSNNLTNTNHSEQSSAGSHT